MPKRDLPDILNTVIRRGFPELLGEDIQIEYLNLKSSLMSYGELTREGFYIEVDSSLRESPQEVLMGGIAHECAHSWWTRQRAGKNCPVT